MTYYNQFKKPFCEPERQLPGRSMHGLESIVVLGRLIASSRCTAHLGEASPDLVLADTAVALGKVIVIGRNRHFWRVK